MMTQDELYSEIKRLKKEKNAVILSNFETLFPRLAKDLVNTGGRKKKRKSLKKPSIL